MAPGAARSDVATGARWTGEGSYHLTLRYIGEVDQGTAHDIDAVLGHINVEPFDITLSGIDYFGKAKSARAVWVGIDRNDTLIRLQHKIEFALQHVGLPAKERKYTPHVTLARLRDTPARRLEAYVADHVTLAAGPFQVNRFTLFSSFPSSSGAIYTREAQYELSCA